MKPSILTEGRRGRNIGMTALPPFPSDDLIDQARRCVADLDQQFLRLAALMWELRDRTPVKHWDDVCSMIGIGGRKGYYLASLHEAVAARPHLHDDLIGLGWTKSALLADKLTTRAAKRWISVAAKCSVVDLQARLRGKNDDRKVVVFSLSQDQRGRLDDALRMFGMTGRGVGKANALMRILKKASSH